ncbi:cytochrome P450 [Streptomyces sp. 549]|uniref:cytochrome P450 n=1 Tax=Streptomyces sp. 549 TaxID=3049076 RepID=UPI0024C3D298|nr:cytochrome P450 [Streptomyces sp. 549]MDK1474808.1 cytochrome P450 [Streptomyces sp. 549]
MSLVAPRGPLSVSSPQLRLADPHFWGRPASERNAVFEALRQAGPPVFVPGPHGGGRGHYALVRHADVVKAARTPQVFLSGPGVTTPEPARWVRTVFGDSMVNLDDPEHAALRRIVSRAFTPRLITRLEDGIRETAARVTTDAARAGSGDFVATVAGRLPYEVICSMMGIPERQRARILHLVDQASAHAGVHRSLRARVRVPGRGLRALARMHLIIAALGRERRRSPREDLISALVTADVDGRSLTYRQLGSFFSLLLVAGVETTRNALAHGLHLLTEHPEQRALMLSDLDSHLDGAVEEMVRHSTPIIQFRRTLACEFELGGRLMAAGDKVALYFLAANRDPSVFTDPDAFDITRSPNPHVGFGGGGPHFCLGTHLARQEMRALFRELLTRLPQIRSTGSPRLVPSSFDNRVASLPFRC